MTPTRQLVAIMFTDIVGYSSVMSQDEDTALQLLEKNRQIHKTEIQEFNGRLLKEMGDGILASFSTVSEAVNCARKIQEACRAYQIYHLG